MVEIDIKSKTKNITIAPLWGSNLLIKIKSKNMEKMRKAKINKTNLDSFINTY